MLKICFFPPAVALYGCFILTVWFENDVHDHMNRRKVQLDLNVYIVNKALKGKAGKGNDKKYLCYMNDKKMVSRTVFHQY